MNSSPGDMEILIDHICEACGIKFKVKQGSRRRFCKPCQDKRQKAGKRIEK